MRLTAGTDKHTIRPAIDTFQAQRVVIGVLQDICEPIAGWSLADIILVRKVAVRKEIVKPPGCE